MQGKRKGAEAAAKAGKAKSRATSAKKGSAKRPRSRGKGRLQPGQLDGLVLGYMKRHKAELPVSPTKVAQGIKRSSGAVGNCLGRLEKENKVRLTGEKPRRYDLTGSKK